MIAHQKVNLLLLLLLFNFLLFLPVDSFNNDEYLLPWTMSPWLSFNDGFFEKTLKRLNIFEKVRIIIIRSYATVHQNTKIGF